MDLRDVSTEELEKELKKELIGRKQDVQPVMESGQHITDAQDHGEGNYTVLGAANPLSYVPVNN